jgi:hypothetical protein
MLTAQGGWANMDILQLNPARHDRFYVGADKAFIGTNYNWSGVGRGTSGAWLTMISPTYFVSAAHWHPGPGETITFWEGSSNGTPTHTYAVASGGYQTTNGPGASDLWLGRLTAPLDAAHRIVTYPVLKQASDAEYLKRELFAYGAPHRVGRNLIDSIIDYTVEGGNTRLVKFDYTVTNSTVGGDECHLIVGDSGGPAFVACNGELALIGTAYTTSDTSPFPTNPMWSGDAFVPFYIDQLNAHMTNGEQVRTVTITPTPERLAYDGFSYAPGGIGGRSGGIGWTNAWSDETHVDVVSLAAPLVYSNGNVEVSGGLSAVRFNGTVGFTAAAIQRGIPVLRTITNLYMSCLVAYTNGTLQGWRTAFIGRNYPSVAPAADRQTGVGFGSIGGVTGVGWVAHCDMPVQLGSVKPVINTTYFLVAKLTWSQGADAIVQAEGWINPTDVNSESGTALGHALGAPQTPYTLDAGGLRTAWLGNFDNTDSDPNKAQFLMDEIRVGTTWRSVFPPGRGSLLRIQ